MINKIADVAYMAGMIDGEGCINISKRMARKGINPSYRLELIIANNHRGMLARLQALWGGSVHTRPNGRAHTLRLAAHDTLRCLTQCLPFLLIKGDQARLALHFYETFQETQRTDDLYTRREAYFQALKAMRYNYSTT